MAEWLGGGLQNLIQRFESAPDLIIRNKMAVTRLKRKDRKNKVVAKREQADIRLRTSLEIEDRSVESPNSQIAKNREVLAGLEAELKK